VATGSLWRVVADWTGGKIGTGFSNIYFTGGTSTPQACADATRAFFGSALVTGSNLPTGVNINFRSTVDVVDSMTGHLSNQLPVTAPAAVSGGGTARYSALAGSCVTWRTADFLNGHRVRGRTFLVPLDGGAMQADGTIDNTALGFMNTAAAALVAAAPELVVWHRPTAPAATDGAYYVVVSGTAADKSAYLTSRR
jgi:hypothetical protein